MQKPKTRTEPFWPNLRYATLSDIRKELPGTLATWALVSTIAVVIGFFAGSIAPSATNWESPLPHWANYAIVCSAVLCFMRGKTIHYRMPMMSVGTWIGFSVYIAVLGFIAYTFPWWVSVPVYWGVLLLVSLLDTLDAQGKENSEAFAAARGTTAY